MRPGVLKFDFMIPSLMALMLTGGCRSPISKPEISGNQEIVSPKYLPLDRSMIRKYGLNYFTLQKNLRYYISEDLVLRRVLPQGTDPRNEISAIGKLVIVDGQANEEIRIPRYTQGHFTNFVQMDSSFSGGPDSLYVVFETYGSPFVFATDIDTPTSRFVLSLDKGNTVSIFGTRFVAIGDVSGVVLLIEKSALNGLNGDKRVLDKLLMQEWQ